MHSGRTPHRDNPYPLGFDFDKRRVDPDRRRSLSRLPRFDSITITSTVRRGGLSTSTMKSERMHERMLCSCKLRLRRASPTVGSHSRHRVRVRRNPMRGTNYPSTDFSHKPLWIVTSLFGYPEQTRRGPQSDGSQRIASNKGVGSSAHGCSEKRTLSSRTLTSAGSANPR